jgi:hypothetical protein
MPTSTDTTPSGFNEVPPHLQARNFLQHIEKFTTSKRAKNTHATSKSRYKFRKLCQNVKEWKINPEANLKSMRTAWYEWNISGIKELSDRPGTYLFMRAIMTDEEESEESEDTRASHNSTQGGTGIGIPITAKTVIEKNSTQGGTGIGIPITDKTVIEKKDGIPGQRPNPFFTLEKANSRTWAQRAQPKIDLTQHLQQSSADSQIAQADSQSVTLLGADSQSVNLLGSTSSTEPEQDLPTKDTIASLSNEVLELRSLILELTTWKDQTAPMILETSKDAHAAKLALNRTDIIQMDDQIHQIRSIYETNQMMVAQEIQASTDENRTLQTRIENLESEEWIPHQEYRTATNNIHADIEVIANTVKKHYEEQNTKMDSSSIQVLYDKQEDITEALNALYESIRDDLLKETKETLIAEIDYEMKQDQSIQDRIDKITQDVFSSKDLATIMSAALDAQLEGLKADARTQMEQHLARILEPTARKNNPCNPIDRALKLINNEIEDMVKHATNKIDEITRGTIDQAIEDV